MARPMTENLSGNNQLLANLFLRHLWKVNKLTWIIDRNLFLCYDLLWRFFPHSSRDPGWCAECQGPKSSISSHAFVTGDLHKPTEMTFPCRSPRARPLWLGRPSHGERIWSCECMIYLNLPPLPCGIVASVWRDKWQQCVPVITTYIIVSAGRFLKEPMS